MAQVALTINGRSYSITCQDGEEARLYQLATVLEQHLVKIKKESSNIGEIRLFMMAGLFLADQLYDTQIELKKAKEKLAEVEALKIPERLSSLKQRLKALNDEVMR